MMQRGWWVRLLTLFVCVGWAVIYVIPTLMNLDPKTSKFPFKGKLNLGLDLQGGIYMVLGIDFDDVYREVVERMHVELEDALKQKQFKNIKTRLLTEGVPKNDIRIVVEFDPSESENIRKYLEERFWTLRVTGKESNRLELGLSLNYRGDIKNRTLDQSIEVIRNRIDQFGVTEPTIASQGVDRVIVELPGVRDIERAKSLIGRTARLELKLVNDEAMKEGSLEGLIAQIEKENKLEFKAGEGQKFSEYSRAINEKAKGKIPEKTEIAFERLTGQTGQVIGYRPYLNHSKVEVSGDELLDAQVNMDENRQPIVSFTLNPKGAVKFEEVTGKNIHKRLAIVLDDIVYSAPMIQSKISSRGQITLGRGGYDEKLKEAKDLAIVLRAGALPAELKFLEQRVVGPSLGQDSIKKGVFASITGALAVFLFMLLYYRVSGAIAILSLILNVLFVVAVLVGLEATLTLPGIAGIALTVGIAVDSNVVIYERIREELRAGKNIYGAVESGFQKAFRTILDANVTNAFAALVLWTYGTGPVKGFAVTMLVGIVVTLYTAVFVSRLIFDYYIKRLERRPQAALSI